MDAFIRFIVAHSTVVQLISGMFTCFESSLAGSDSAKYYAISTICSCLTLLTCEFFGFTNEFGLRDWRRS